VFAVGLVSRKEPKNKILDYNISNISEFLSSNRGHHYHSILSV